MGARGTIRIIQPYNSTPIHFYTHWEGHRLAQNLARGIRKAHDSGRLNDTSYATRIIFDVFTGLEGGSTGFGICVGDEAQPGDVEYDTPTLQWTEERIPEVIYGGVTYNALEFAAQMLGPAMVPR
jgi:hypothetical protein